jgi:hypothetical protein
LPANKLPAFWASTIVLERSKKHRLNKALLNKFIS